MQASDLWHGVLLVSEQMAKVHSNFSFCGPTQICLLTHPFLDLQAPDAHLHHVRALHTDETHLPGVPPAADHPGGVPLHEGLASLQHQWVFALCSERTKQQSGWQIAFHEFPRCLFPIASDLTSVSLCLHQFQLKVWRAKSTLMNCVLPTSTNSIDSSNIEWPPIVLRGSTSWPDSWTLSKWWGVHQA